MKTTVKSFLLLVFASAFLAACEKCNNINITEPTQSEIAWLVYNSNDTLYFRTEAGDTVMYRRTGIYAQNVPGEGYSVEDECIEELNTRVTNILEEEQRQQPFLATSVFSKPDSLLIKIGVGNNSSWMVDTTSAMQEVTVLGNTYDAFVFEGTNTTATAPKTVYFNKIDGFLKIEFNDGKKLELINR